jgi:hypothetical protein
VTVSSVPDEQSGEVGGLQNTLTNLGISVGTALSGALVMAPQSGTFLTGVEQNSAVPAPVKSQVSTHLASGVPFISDEQLKAGLDHAGVPPDAANAIVEENEQARLAGLRAGLSVLALMALIGLVISRRLPARQPGATAELSGAAAPG